MLSTITSICCSYRALRATRIAVSLPGQVRAIIADEFAIITVSTIEDILQPMHLERSAFTMLIPFYHRRLFYGFFLEDLRRAISATIHVSLDVALPLTVVYEQNGGMWCRLPGGT